MRDTPLNTVLVEHQKRAIISHMTNKSLRSDTLSFRKDRLGFLHKEVGTHSIWSCFSMEIFLAKVYPETITIMVQWVISAFLRYVRIQVSGLSKGISTLITNRQDL